MSLDQATSTRPRLRHAYSVAEFCQAYGLSAPMFYKLRAKGQAPDVMKVGARTLISVEAADKWRKKLERAAKREAAA
jgi:predicted DNA-binding transcriptional regulator AlpA